MWLNSHDRKWLIFKRPLTQEHSAGILRHIIPECVPFFMVVYMLDGMPTYKYFLRKRANGFVDNLEVNLIRSIWHVLKEDSEKKFFLSLTNILFKEALSYHPFVQIKYGNSADKTEIYCGETFENLVKVLNKEKADKEKAEFFYGETILKLDCLYNDFINSINIPDEKPTGEFYNITDDVLNDSRDEAQIEDLNNKLYNLKLDGDMDDTADKLVRALYIYKYFPWEKYMYYVPGHIGINFPCDGIILFATDEIGIPDLFNLQYKLNRLGGIKRIEELQESTTRIAIISILVDSFAHNIAAHSLSAMVWFLKQCEENESDTPMKGNASFSQYLCNKATFWSGVTRDFECGGEIRTWYDVLNDFADNPLFLGTIAHSEGIHKVKIKVGYGEKDSADETKEFETIDLNSMFKKEENGSGKSGGGGERSKQSPLSQDGNDKKVIGEELSKDKWRLFLPNGIVGQQALYTIFENTIRNIKHAENLEKQKEIEFNIFIELFDEKRFNIIVWLGNKTRIIEEEKDNEGNDVKVNKKINDLLKKPVVTENGTPRMGGNSQDKICASMLYNNIFRKVDVEDKGGRYPWIHVWPKPNSDSKRGVIQRSFCVWKGADKLEIKKRKDLDDENPARFKFVIVPKSEEDPEPESGEQKQGLKNELAEKGIVRIMDRSEYSGKDLDSLYKAWNEKWIKADRNIVTVLGKGTTTAFTVFHDNAGWNHNDSDQNLGCDFSKINKNYSFVNDKDYSTISFKHRGDSKEGDLEYANHCVFIERFLSEEGYFIKDKMKDEFTETLLTNIEIYDNRIFDRVDSRNGKKDILTKKLFLHVYDENIQKTAFKNKVKNSKANFIIIHLSYIKSLGYDDENINKFIEEYFKESLNDNLKLVITTGRGRGAWHDNLKSLDAKYRGHVLFKAIDSLLDAVEDGLIDRDDFQVKYNLVKVLFGS